jgi:hypothetical protein
MGGTLRPLTLRSTFEPKPLTYPPFEHMFDPMNQDNWAILHRRAAELLHAVVLWNPPPRSPAWQAMCPHIARLTKVLLVADVLDESGGSPAEPVWRDELLASSEAVARACELHGGSVRVLPQVTVAANRLAAAIDRCRPPLQQVPRAS